MDARDCVKIEKSTRINDNRTLDKFGGFLRTSLRCLLWECIDVDSYEMLSMTVD